MRPETKERADTTVGLVLRGSFTFYQATAGDVEEGGMKKGGGGGWKKKVFSVCQRLSEAELISRVESGLRHWELLRLPPDVPGVSTGPGAEGLRAGRRRIVCLHGTRQLETNADAEVTLDGVSVPQRGVHCPSSSGPLCIAHLPS